MTKKIKREVEGLVQAAGLRLVDLTHAGAHLRAVVAAGDKTRKTFFPATPSDHRWKINQLTFLKRLRKEMANAQVI